MSRARIDGEEVMTALSAKTGERLWRAGYLAPYTPGEPAAAHGAGPKATPLFHNGRLFTLGISGIVAAFDAVAGRLLWKTPPPAEPPYFSASSSPVADAGVVLVHPGNYEPLTAYRRHDRPREVDQQPENRSWTGAGSGGRCQQPDQRRGVVPACTSRNGTIR